MIQKYPQTNYRALANSMVYTAHTIQTLLKGPQELNTKNNNSQNNCWGYIPSYHTRVHDFLIATQHLNSKDLIIDAGCGWSPVLNALSTLGFTKLIGIEYNKNLIDQINNSQILNIIHANLITNEILNRYQKQYYKNLSNLYKKAKAIYMYQPIQTPKDAIQTIRNIANNIPVGCILMECDGPINFILQQSNIFKYNQKLGFFTKTKNKRLKLSYKYSQ